VNITINGDKREVPGVLSVAALLALLGINAERVAIERNLEILPRARWKETRVEPEDRYEIVHLVGGG
jgi:sulfur carrier protein